MEDCIFCNIISGKIPCSKVFENEQVLAFLDIDPISRGHCLVIPKKHAQNIVDIQPESLAEVAKVAKQVAVLLETNLKAEGINLLQSNNTIAGQLVPHFHIHVIPRYSNDGIIGNWGHKEHSPADPKELALIAKEIMGS